MSKNELIQEFNDASQVLLRAQDLSPRNKAAEKAVLSLIDMCIENSELVAEQSQQMSEHDLLSLRRAFLEADCEMEKYWSEKIIQSVGEDEALSWDNFGIYPWFQDYPALYDFEKRAIEKTLGPITEDTTITYFGSGALPIIPLMLALETGCQIKCVDINDGAVNLSTRLIDKMGLSDKISVHKGDGISIPEDHNNPDLLFLANAPLSVEDALNNMLPTMQPKVIFARSSAGGTALLYPSISENAFSKSGYEIDHVAQDHEHGTHTGLVYERPQMRKPV